MDQRVVNVPLVGGINEDDDTFSLTPPEMKSLINVSAVKKGALDRRFGWELVPKHVEGDGFPMAPATSYVGTTAGAVSPSVEALSTCDTPSGRRAVMAAGNKFYEYVGADATHGFREVNDLPRYCGTLATAASTGGSVIEIESALFANDTKRVTVWTTGLRTGTELASDVTAQSQTSGDGNSLYYSVQWVENEAYIVPPTRMKNVSSAYVTSAQDLRLVLIANFDFSGDSDWPFVLWYDSTTGQVVSALIDPTTGAQKPANNLPKLIASFPNCHRRFDAVSIRGLPNDPTIYRWFVYAMCQADTGNNAVSAKLEVRMAQVNLTTGVVTSSPPLPDAMALVGPTLWQPWAQRGVTLEQYPEVTATMAGSWQAKINVAARVVARKITGGIPQFMFDGHIAATTLTVDAGMATIVPDGWQFLPCVGFQTTDNIDNVIASAASPLHVSGVPDMQAPYRTNAPTNLPIWPFAPYGPYDADGQPVRTSEIAMTAQLTDDGLTRQTYFCSFQVDNSTGSYAVALYPQSVFAYRDARNGGSDTYPEGSFKKVSNAYPRPLHRYKNDQPIAMNTVVPNATRQTNVITVPVSGPANTGWTPGTYTQVPILDVGTNTEICTATIHIASNGSLDAIAIEDCATGPGPGFAYGTAFANTPVTLSPVGGWNAGVTGVLTAKGYNLASPEVGATLKGHDTPDRDYVAVGTNALFYSGGMEHCVHRWTVGRRHAMDGAFLAVSSVSAIRETNPQGDLPFGAASPLRYNNFFEVYYYDAIPSWSYTPLVNPSGGTSNALVCALGGPWRIVGGMVEDDDEMYLAVCPGGDDSQASTFLLRLPKEFSGTITTPAGDQIEGGYPSPDAVTYSFTNGVFIESANIMRTTAPPLNVPAIHRTSKGLTTGALRESSSKGQQSCLAIDYEVGAQNWRTMQRCAEYTFINGGILSVFDSVNCNEHGLLVWPQRDLTSISFGDGGAQPAFIAVNASAFTSAYAQVSVLANTFNVKFSPLRQITRPYFFNESGMRYESLTTSSTGVGYDKIQTNWGGDPSRSYESVFQELRTQQFSSFTKSGVTGGTAKYGAHYYGRYQSTPTDFSELIGSSVPAAMVATDQIGVRSGYFVWAPRSAKGFSGIKPNGGTQNRYSQDETGGNFLLSFCYEYMDGTGRIVRSAPSSPVQWTICTEVITHGLKPEDDRQGGMVTSFYWGFFAPRLELTNRTKSAAADPRRVTLQPYSTIEPYATVMYRMPWGNFLNPISSFVIDRNTSRSVVPFASKPFNGATTAFDMPCGFVVTNTNVVKRGCFDGPTGDFNGMLREPYLYTTGGILDNVAPPSCKAMCVHQNRLVIGGADDSTVVWFSKELSPTDAPGFNDLLTIRIEAGGAVTGLASMNSSLFIFKENDVYVVSGSMPDDTGNGNTLAEPVRLPSGIGCIDPRSVISTPIGVFFQSKRSIELLTPDLRITPIGDKIIEQRQTFPYVTSVAHNATTEEIYFVLHNRRVTRDDVGCITKTFVYSYKINAWYEWRNTVNELGRGMAAITVVGDKAWMAMRNPTDAAASAYVYRQWNGYVDKIANPLDDAYGLSYYVREFLTAPFALNQVQGFQRVKRVRLLASAVNSAPSQAEYDLTVFTDKATPQTSSWSTVEVDDVVTAQGMLQLEAHVAQQKGQYMALGVEEKQPTTVLSTVENFRWANIALVVGLKQGLNKRITEDAKH